MTHFLAAWGGFMFGVLVMCLMAMAKDSESRQACAFEEFQVRKLRTQK